MLWATPSIVSRRRLAALFSSRLPLRTSWRLDVGLRLNSLREFLAVCGRALYFGGGPACFAFEARTELRFLATEEGLAIVNFRFVSGLTKGLHLRRSDITLGGRLRFGGRVRGGHGRRRRTRRRGRSGGSGKCRLYRLSLIRRQWRISRQSVRARADARRYQDSDGSPHWNASPSCGRLRCLCHAHRTQVNANHPHPRPLRQRPLTTLRATRRLARRPSAVRLSSMGSALP
jgi:hypothetical protein